MNIIGIIPSRYQSTRFPGKPLAMINGRPMIWWVYQQAIKVESFSDVYVATDSKEIEDVCLSYNMKVIMTSSEHKTGTDRLGEVAKKIPADFYVNIQGDEPLIEPETISQIVEYKRNNNDVQIINSMTRIKNLEDVDKKTVVKVVAADNNDLIYLSRSAVPYPKKGQKIEYFKHLGLYGLSREALLFFSSSPRTKNELIEDIEMLRFLENGYKIKILNVESNSIGVDCPEDIENVKKYMIENNIKVEN